MKSRRRMPGPVLTPEVSARAQLYAREAVRIMMEHVRRLREAGASEDEVLVIVVNNVASAFVIGYAGGNDGRRR